MLTSGKPNFRVRCLQCATVTLELEGVHRIALDTNSLSSEERYSGVPNLTFLQHTEPRPVGRSPDVDVS